MPNYVLYGVLAIIAICVIIGMIKGFVTMIFSLSSTIIVLIITITLTTRVAGVLEHIQGLNNYVTTTLEEQIKIDVDGTVDISNFTRADLVRQLGLPKIIETVIASAVGEKSIEMGECPTLHAYLVMMLGKIVFMVLGFLITFAVASIIMFTIVRLLDVISKLPVLHQLNALLGGAAGAVFGIVIVWFLLIVINLLAGTAVGKTAILMIQENPFLTFLQENNLLTTILTKLAHSLFD